jgi:hypothetical protein
MRGNSIIYRESIRGVIPVPIMYMSDIDKLEFSTINVNQ